MVLKWLVRFGPGVLVPAAGCCCRLLLQGAGLAVPLQDAAAGCQSAVRFGAGVLVPLRGGAANCCFRVLLSCAGVAVGVAADV